MIWYLLGINLITFVSYGIDKFKAITAYPAQFPYDGRYYTYPDMVIFKGGDCWASSYTMERLCMELISIKQFISIFVLVNIVYLFYLLLVEVLVLL